MTENPAKPQRRWPRRCLILAAVAVGAVLAAVGAFEAAVAWAPYPPQVRHMTPCTWIEARDGTPLVALAGSSGEWYLPLDEQQISPHLLDAIVAVEDKRFREHGGVDWLSALGACWQDARSLSCRRGASTITMQLYRLQNPARRSLWAKLDQAVRACQLERQMSKRQILVAYANQAPFGGNLVGAGAASWRYFGRPCKDLSLAQAALLAALPQNPNHLRPDRFPDRARQRRDVVLDCMLACGLITDQQRRQAQQEPIDAAWRPLPQEMVRDDGLLPTLLDLGREYPGKTIRTTLDLQVQLAAAAMARQCLDDLSASHVGAAAVVVLDNPSGDCLAAVSLLAGNRGDRDEAGDARDVDLTRRPRSSGSALKPFIYAAAFDAGICSPQTLVDDSPAAWAGYEPENYDHEFRGQLPAFDALAQSRNLPAIMLLSKVGLQRAVSVMGAMGLRTLARTPDRYGLPLAIGGAEVTPVELAQAYATLARGGIYKPARLTDLDPPAPVAEPGGGALARSLHGSVLRRQTCLATLYCLADPARTASVFAPAAELSPAWKTGTSSGHRDAWCAAVSRARTVVVWLGNADGSGSDRLVGQDAAAPLALKLLTNLEAHGEGFVTPPGFAVPEAAGQNSAQPVSLAMLSPGSGQVILHDPSLPANQQRLALQARCTGAETRRIWWFIDGGCIGRSDAGEEMWWSPAAGEHEVRAVDGQGHSAVARIRVQSAP